MNEGANKAILKTHQISDDEPQIKDNSELKNRENVPSEQISLIKPMKMTH